MTLLSWQRAFRAEIAASDEDGAPGSTGMAIYRDAYRGRLAAALASSFEQTRRWVGAEPFDIAAAHYILTCPPTGWTLDSYGAGFPALLSELFAQNPEVSELAWFEWHLQQAFAAPDGPALDTERLAAAALEADDWNALRLFPAAGFASRRIETACVALWRSLTKGDESSVDLSTPTCRWLTVWRQNEQPHFRFLADEEHFLLQLLVTGTPLGAALEQRAGNGGDAIENRIGDWLAQWLSEGLFSDYTLADGA